MFPYQLQAADEYFDLLSYVQRSCEKRSWVGARREPSAQERGPSQSSNEHTAAMRCAGECAQCVHERFGTRPQVSIVCWMCRLSAFWS
jgi:hypothetical protein